MARRMAVTCSFTASRSCSRAVFSARAAARLALSDCASWAPVAPEAFRASSSSFSWLRCWTRACIFDSSCFSKSMGAPDPMLNPELRPERFRRGQGRRHPAVHFLAHEGAVRLEAQAHEPGLATLGQALGAEPVSYTHLRAHETDSYLVCRLL